MKISNKVFISDYLRMAVIIFSYQLMDISKLLYSILGIINDWKKYLDEDMILKEDGLERVKDFPRFSEAGTGNLNILYLIGQFLTAVYYHYSTILIKKYDPILEVEIEKFFKIWGYRMNARFLYSEFYGKQISFIIPKLRDRIERSLEVAKNVEKIIIY